jgi:hypothetical protein
LRVRNTIPKTAGPAIARRYHQKAILSRVFTVRLPDAPKCARRAGQRNRNAATPCLTYCAGLTSNLVLQRLEQKYYVFPLNWLVAAALAGSTRIP